MTPRPDFEFMNDIYSIGDSSMTVVMRGLILSSPADLSIFHRKTFQIAFRTRPSHVFRFSSSHARPTNAPRPVVDSKHVANNPGLYAQNCIDRNYTLQAQYPWEILELSKRRKDLGHKTSERKQRQVSLRRLMEEAAHSGQESSQSQHSLRIEAKSIKAELNEDLQKETDISDMIQELTLALPNLSSAHTPNGDEHEIIQLFKAQESKNFHNKSHVDIGHDLDILDFAAASTSSGWGWYYLKNEAALMEQALIQYAIHVLYKRKWTIVSPPSIVYSHIATACGFQPRDQNDEQQIYSIQRPEKDASKPSLSLTATAEIPLAALNADKTIPLEQLPLKTVAVSRCYRAEAGARGVDTKGLYRVHEFTKVEMFAWTNPDRLPKDNLSASISSISESAAVFDEMIDAQVEILSSLGLTFRLLEMSATDLGASANRKRDIEAFFPSRQAKDAGWGEVTSTSICTDYQSRRLATRMRLENGKLDWPYTVNGTALAVPRVLAAILETHWDETLKCVHIPAALRPYMHGRTSIPELSSD